MGAVQGIVVNIPCCQTFNHSAANFGADSFYEYTAPLKLPMSTETSCGFYADEEVSGSIALVLRGGCSFVDKALIAQRNGAKGVIIYNHNSADPDALVSMASTTLDGMRVTIPAVFVSHRTGMALVDMLLNSTDSDEQPVVTISVIGETLPYGPGSSSMVYSVWVFLGFGFVLLIVVKRIQNQCDEKKRLAVVHLLPTRRYVGASKAETVPEGGESTTRLSSTDAEPLSATAEPLSLLQTTAERHPKQRDMLRVSQSEEEEAQNNTAQEGGADDIEAPPFTDYYGGENCVICLCDFEAGELITVLPCGHGYHKECIEPWLISKSALCPICKTSILPSGASGAIGATPSPEEEEGRRDSSDSRLYPLAAILVTTFLAGALFIPQQEY